MGGDPEAGTEDREVDLSGIDLPDIPSQIDLESVLGSGPDDLDGLSDSDGDLDLDESDGFSSDFDDLSDLDDELDNKGFSSSNAVRSRRKPETKKPKEEPSEKGEKAADERHDDVDSFWGSTPTAPAIDKSPLPSKESEQGESLRE